MPFYLYICCNKQCNTDEFEVQQSMNDLHEATCPECGQPAKRLILPTGISFKGPGFHVNDYPSG